MKSLALRLGVGVAFALGELADFRYADTAPAPYGPFIEYFTAAGELCTGASIALGVAKTLLDGVPSGQPPAALCLGRTCGDDGCGGSCGTCSGSATCSADGACVTACVPSCAARTCGESDGCGGSCSMACDGGTGGATTGTSGAAAPGASDAAGGASPAGCGCRTAPAAPGGLASGALFVAAALSLLRRRARGTCRRRAKAS